MSSACPACAVPPPNYPQYHSLSPLPRLSTSTDPPPLPSHQSHTAGTFAEVTREMLANLDSFLSAKNGEAPQNAVNRVDRSKGDQDGPRGNGNGPSEDAVDDSKLLLKVRLRGV